MIELKTLKCPVCCIPMSVRILNNEHINKASKKLSKQKYYQYFCQVHDIDGTGWTTTESDELSLKL